MTTLTKQRNTRTTRSAEGPLPAGTVLYEVSVRGFFDSNDDGIGDLRGLTDKLDYLAWLGVGCIWLLPIFESPHRDGGYDVSDFRTILPAYGDLIDFRRLVDEAHRRGILVIIDLVINHTSDQHPWFRESRRGRVNPKADWYVWSDHCSRYPQAEVIFADSESSVWSWAPEREQWYLHRFMSCQPDLNYDNPEVQHEIIEVARFWAEVVDGFRLDAVAYLYERDDTTCENLPETHDFLRRLRKELDATRPGTLLLAEVNQSPVDSADYFGSGDECHLAFDFGLMTGVFLGVGQQRRQPIVDVLTHNSVLPPGCGRVNFLRNHDELCAMKLTAEQRAVLCERFGDQIQCAMGIPRRLAPLIENDRTLNKLLHALLVSLPGTPCLYYGDEIGMGDNIYLNDRDGVRTPMQWNSDRNGGFSRADPARVYPPPLMNPVFGYQALNVEAQRLDPSSFLHWVRRTLTVRKTRGELFETGDFEDVSPGNSAILAFVRRKGDQTVLCIYNLSPFVQQFELPLAAFEGRAPVSLFGGDPLSTIGRSPYQWMSGGHAFDWLDLRETGVIAEGAA